MKFLYNLIILIYYFLIKLSAPFNKKAKLWVDGRKNWESIFSKKRNFNETWIWFHCSSLGEYEDCSEIFQQIQQENPSKKTLLTFFSPSGFEAMNQSVLFDLVMYLPLDTPKNSKLFLNILQPTVVFFSRSELWYNFLKEIKKRNIPAFLISLRLNQKSAFISCPSNIIYKLCFQAFTFIFCQNELTQKILISNFGLKNILVTGNTRFDSIYNKSLQKIEIPFISTFVNNNFVIVAGSCMPKDESIIRETIKKLESLQIKWILVPHEIDNEQIDKIIAINPKATIRYSAIGSLSASHTVLYFDNVGQLKHLYKYANLAIVGGGFDKIGIHNIIEPSVYGVPAAFGPNHKNYSEATDLLRICGSTTFCNANDLYEIIMNRVLNPTNDYLKEKTKNYVLKNTGGSLRIIKFIRTKFSGLI